MPVTYSTAKIYKNFARNLVMEVCFRDIFHRNLDHHAVRKSFGEIDFETEFMRRIFFSCNGVDYTIRLWSIEDVSPKGNRKRIDYSTHGWYTCNDCDNEFARDIPNNDCTRCNQCAKSKKQIIKYKLDENGERVGFGTIVQNTFEKQEEGN